MVVTGLTPEGTFWSQVQTGQTESYSRLMEGLQEQASEVRHTAALPSLCNYNAMDPLPL